MRSSRLRSRAGSRGAAALLGAVLLATWLAAAAFAAEPSASPGAGGDPRSSGEGPGLVGEPAVAIAIVAVVGLVALGGTLLYVRATGGPRPS
jgi:hypothetical protein